MASNKDKILQAVLQDENLMKFGEYSLSDIGNIYQALESDNYVINAVAQIIDGVNNKVSENELWKQINNYLNLSV